MYLSPPLSLHKQGKIVSIGFFMLQKIIKMQEHFVGVKQTSLINWEGECKDLHAWFACTTASDVYRCKISVLFLCCILFHLWLCKPSVSYLVQPLTAEVFLCTIKLCSTGSLLKSSLCVIYSPMQKFTLLTIWRKLIYSIVSINHGTFCWPESLFSFSDKDGQGFPIDFF